MRTPENKIKRLENSLLKKFINRHVRATLPANKFGFFVLRKFFLVGVGPGPGLGRGLGRGL